MPLTTQSKHTKDVINADLIDIPNPQPVQSAYISYNFKRGDVRPTNQQNPQSQIK